MEIPVPHAAFTRQRLSLQPAGFVTSAKILIDGIPVKRLKGKYPLIDDAGQPVLAELKINLLDPIPQLKLGNEVLTLAPKMQWYEYAWTGLPIILLFVGGGLGALIGISAAYANTRIFRSNRSTGTRFALTGLLSIAATAIFFVLATVIHIAINGMPQ
jgi:hypothetical protein